MPNSFSSPAFFRKTLFGITKSSGCRQDASHFALVSRNRRVISVTLKSSILQLSKGINVKARKFVTSNLIAPYFSPFPTGKKDKGQSHLRKRCIFIRLLLCLSLFYLLFSLACGPKPPHLILDQEDQFALAKREFEKKHYDRAIIEFQKLIFNYSGAVFIDSAQYLLGMSYLNQNDYALAQAEFNKLLSMFPTSQLSDDAAFMVAFCDFKMSPRAELDQERTSKALEELKRFLDDYPESDRANEAQNLLNECYSKLAKKAYENGYLYFKMKQYEAALIYLKDLINEYHDTRWAAPAQFYIAEAYFKQKKYDQAKEEYQKFLENFPDDKLARKAKGRLEKLNSGATQVKK
jgi:outer membrane protein assembly factor BamD